MKLERKPKRVCEVFRQKGAAERILSENTEKTAEKKNMFRGRKSVKAGLFSAEKTVLRRQKTGLNSLKKGRFAANREKDKERAEIFEISVDKKPILW